MGVQGQLSISIPHGLLAEFILAPTSTDRETVTYDLYVLSLPILAKERHCLSTRLEANQLNKPIIFICRISIRFFDVVSIEGLETANKICSWSLGMKVSTQHGAFKPAKI